MSPSHLARRACSPTRGCLRPAAAAARPARALPSCGGGCSCLLQRRIGRAGRSPAGRGRSRPAERARAPPPPSARTRAFRRATRARPARRRRATWDRCRWTTRGNLCPPRRAAARRCGSYTYYGHPYLLWPYLLWRRGGAHPSYLVITPGASRLGARCGGQQARTARGALQPPRRPLTRARVGKVRRRQGAKQAAGATRRRA